MCKGVMVEQVPCSIVFYMILLLDQGLNLEPSGYMPAALSIELYGQGYTIIAAAYWAGLQIRGIVLWSIGLCQDHDLQSVEMRWGAECSTRPWSLTRWSEQEWSTGAMTYILLEGWEFGYAKWQSTRSVILRVLKIWQFGLEDL
ncbi:hypothetical protein SERLA73DRAFT_149296 [Serpula lacrymans var. lacrymans S7.3]|uniref:Uncharacterized protein n=1 Tax=Serpula lacrymans var. lacrymans (strain S7.3) TaxID=936435 RepID=F8PHG2_SERL3|nr:hypothetical protein SERLA73DRAFT_149296 [Serpula lacrymans var. lacrymans S7.3]